MTATAPSRRPPGALTSFVLFVAALLGALVASAAARIAVEPPHLVEMAIWPIVWGALALVGVLLAGRLSFDRWLPVDRLGLALAVTGIGLSAVVHVVLQQWAIARFGYYDPEFVWWTAGLFAFLVRLATSVFGVYVAPRGAAGWPLAGVVLGAIGVVLVVLGNVPGLSDGIEPESWPLAAWLGISGLYAVGVTIASPARARRATRPPFA